MDISSEKNVRKFNILLAANTSDTVSSFATIALQVLASQVVIYTGHGQFWVYPYPYSSVPVPMLHGYGYYYGYSRARPWVQIWVSYPWVWDQDTVGTDGFYLLYNTFILILGAVPLACSSGTLPRQARYCTVKSAGLWNGRQSKFRKCASQSHPSVFKNFGNYGTSCRTELVISFLTKLALKTTQKKEHD